MSTLRVSDIQATHVERRRASRGLVLIAGVIIIPFALALALNSYGALTADGAMRMAFATVAGQTIAILSAVVAVALTIRQKRGWQSIAAFVLVAVLITVFAIGSMSTAADLLLQRLDLVAEVNQINH